jgi:hypothetical protein
MPRVRVPWHVARLVTRLVVDYFALRRLVVDYFTYAARLVASAHCATRRAARQAARCQLLRLEQAHRGILRLRRASGCLGTSRGSSSTTSTMSRDQVPRHVARLITRLAAPLVVDYSASHKLVVD